MTQRRPWPTALTAVLARQVRRYRDAAGLSAQQLAERMTAEVGSTYTRTQVTNLESGRREAITVGELMGFARILGVPPLMLVLPLGEAEAVEVLPGVTVDPWTAWRWVTGEIPAEGLTPAESRDWTVQFIGNPVVSCYRRHEVAVTSYPYAQSEKSLQKVARDVAAARIQMHQNGWELPPIPDAVAELAREPMLGWGYIEEPPGTIKQLPMSVEPTPSDINPFDGPR